jgi:hypothetical protein
MDKKDTRQWPNGQGGARQPRAPGEKPHAHTVILEMIFNMIFILGLNQEQFKEKLITIYGQQNWPSYDVLSQELNMCAKATERMKMLTAGKSNNDGIIKAHIGSTDSSMECWNCGSKTDVKSARRQGILKSTALKRKERKSEKEQ